MMASLGPSSPLKKNQQQVDDGKNPNPNTFCGKIYCGKWRRKHFWFAKMRVLSELLDVRVFSDSSEIPISGIPKYSDTLLGITQPSTCYNSLTVTFQPVSFWMRCFVMSLRYAEAALYGGNGAVEIRDFVKSALLCHPDLKPTFWPCWLCWLWRGSQSSEMLKKWLF